MTDSDESSKSPKYLLFSVSIEGRGSTIYRRQPLPSDLSTIPHPHLPTMCFPRSNIKYPDQSLDALLSGNSGLLQAEISSAAVPKICLNPSAPN